MGAACARDPSGTELLQVAENAETLHANGSSGSTAQPAQNCCTNQHDKQQDQWFSSCNTKYLASRVCEDTDGADDEDIGIVASDRRNASHGLSVEDIRPSKVNMSRNHLFKNSVFVKGRVDLADFFVYTAPKGEVHWLTLVVGHMWEYIEASIAKLLTVDITKQIQEDCADIPVMRSFAFTKCTFGRNTPTFGPLKVRAKDDCVELLVDMDWKADDSLIEMSLGAGLKLGMKDLHMKGPLLIILAPLLKVLPVLGGISVTFTDIPDLTWDWTGVIKALPVPNLKTLIAKGLFQKFVVPSRKFIDLAGLEAMELDEESDTMPKVVDYQSPPPLGILHIQVMEAQQLKNTDLMGKSDPYVVVRIGSSRYTTCKRMNELNPVWGAPHCCDFLVYHMEQHVFVDVYDEDYMGDDTLGYVISHESQTKLTNRPTVSELLEKPDNWWTLRLEERNLESKILLKCSFRKADPGIDPVRPVLVDCAERHGLVELTDGKTGSKLKSLKRCSLCQDRIMRSWSSFVCGGNKFNAGKECQMCNFRVCSKCDIEARPAAGLVRVCFKRGLVPPEDMKAGVVLGLMFEGETLWSNYSYAPYVAPEVLNAELSKAVRKLCLEEDVDQRTVAQCFGMPASKVSGIVKGVEDATQKSWASTNLLPHVMSDKVVVIWDHALHFLVRSPDVDDFKATLIYQSEKHKMKREVVLQRSNQIDGLKKPTKKAKKKVNFASDVDQADSTSVFEVKATWEMTCEKTKKSASVDVEVCFYGLAFGDNMC